MGLKAGKELDAMRTTRTLKVTKIRRPLGGGAPPGRSRPGGRRAAAERHFDRFPLLLPSRDVNP